MDYSDDLARWLTKLDHLGKKGEAQVWRDGAWTSCEILGHLLDSATINRLRIKTICLLPGSEFTGYNQREFVDRNRYKSMEYENILDLWYQMNASFFNLIKGLTPAELNQALPMELFNKISFKLPTERSEQNLRFVITDYVDHLEHHLRQMQSLCE